MIIKIIILKDVNFFSVSIYEEEKRKKGWKKIENKVLLSRFET